MLSIERTAKAENRFLTSRVSEFGEKHGMGLSHQRILSANLCLVLMLTSMAFGAVDTDKARLPSFSRVSATVQRHFAQLAEWRSGDLISQSDVRPIFTQLEQLGWQVSDQDKILKQVSPDNHFLVRTLRSKRGAKFMQQVSGYRLIFDRLDRISAESGGQKMIQSLIKLPDGARYAKQNPGRGIPGMTEFLPKNRSGKSRKVPDYKKPTGKLYTARQFLERLHESYQEDSRRAPR